MYNSITNYNNITHFVPYAKTNWNDDKSIKIPDIQDETYLLLKGKIMLEGGTSKTIIGNYKSYAKVYSDKIFVNTLVFPCRNIRFINVAVQNIPKAIIPSTIRLT